MYQIEFIALVLLGFAILFNVLVFSPNNIGVGAISPVLSISFLILAGGFAYLAFSWRFSKEGREAMRNYEKSEIKSKNDLFVEKMEAEQKARDIRTQEQLRERELSEQRLRSEKESQPKRVSPQYIESVFNKQLNPKNISVKVVLRDSVLQIMYQSEKSLPQMAMVDGTKKLLTLINPSDIDKVKIYFKQSGDDFPKWDDEFELIQPTLPNKETPQSPIVPQPQPQLSRSVNYEPQIRCPKCGSTQIMANKKGFDVGKAIVGSVVTLGVGAVAGLWGSNDIQLNCLNCGHRWEPEKPS